jgi:hypothetical protein
METIGQKKAFRITDCTLCFVSRQRETIIDVLHPETGLTVCYSKTLEETRREYPDAEEMNIAEFCAWKARKQRTPIAWVATTEERYYEMLCALPPADVIGGAFLLGEPQDHDAGTGKARFDAYRCRDGVYEASSRPMTVAEFRAEMSVKIDG